jgi:hypothetical protein
MNKALESAIVISMYFFIVVLGNYDKRLLRKYIFLAYIVTDFALYKLGIKMVTEPRTHSQKM